MASLVQLVEQVVGLGIFLVALSLATLSYLAWRRERDRRMQVVSVAYLLFMLYGLVVFLEYTLMQVLPVMDVELLEHASGLFILAGLLAFFAAITRE